MENKNKSKSVRRKLFFTRCGIFAMLLLMLLSMLCSFVPLNAHAAEDTITLKAGTYRFNDKLTQLESATDDGVVLNIPFTFQVNIINLDGTFLSGIAVGTAIQQDAGYGSTEGVSVRYTASLNGNDVSAYYYDGTSWQTEFITQEVIDAYYNEGYIDQNIYDIVIGYFNQGYKFYGDGIQTITVTNDTEVGDIVGTWFIANTNYNEVNGIIDTTVFTDVWSSLLDWFISSFASIQGLFISGDSAEGYSLTLLGTLAVIGVSIAIVFLLIMVIQRFLRLRS